MDDPREPRQIKNIRVAKPDEKLTSGIKIKEMKSPPRIYL